MSTRFPVLLGVSLLTLVAATSLATAQPEKLGTGVNADALASRLARPAPAARSRGAAEDDSNADLFVSRGLIARTGPPANVVAVDPARPSQARVEPAAEPPSVALDVKFEFNSAQLTPEARQLVGELAKALKRKNLAADSFQLEGHTDSVGKRSYNIDLSERRAQAVRAYLAELGVPTERIAAVGRGPDYPLDPQHPESGTNRRVQVINVTR